MFFAIEFIIPALLSAYIGRKEARMRSPGSRFAVCTLALVASTAFVPSGRAQSDPDIYLYRGPDREQRLVARAKQEGAVSLYTSMQLPDSQPLTRAFEKKYGIRVALWRASGEKVVQRVLVESRAGRFDVDVVETDGAQMEALYREKQFAPFYSPSSADIPANIVPAHKHYVPTRLSLYVLVYNTKLVPPGEVPKSYEELLDRKWSGRLGVEAADVAWFAAVAKAMGVDKGLAYFQKLAANRPSVRSGHTLLAELVASGELALAPDAHIQGVARLKARGAPVDWKPLEPAFGQPSSVGVMRRAPHPHAALLFADFILSREGQEIIKARNRVPSSRAVDSPLNRFDYGLVDPVIVLDEWDQWEKRWSDLFLKGRRVQKGAE
jgi:iron(III) transport system substrate-binding protein